MKLAEKLKYCIKVFLYGYCHVERDNMELQIVDVEFYQKMEENFDKLSDDEKLDKIRQAFDKKHIFRRVHRGKKEEKIAAYLCLRHKVLKEKYFDLFKQVWREKRTLYLADKPMAKARALKKIEKKIAELINKKVTDENIDDDLEFMCGHDKQMKKQVEFLLNELQLKWLFNGGDNDDISFEEMIMLGKMEKKYIKKIMEVVKNSIYEYNNFA